MKRYLILFTAIILMFIISGCSTNQSDSKVPEAIEVEIQMPEQIIPNEEVTLQALVTQGKEKVNDANEVEFEIWENGQDEHKLVKAASKGKGIYAAKFTFPKDGTYNVTAHVTARDMHTMPNKEVIVGSK